MGDVGVWREGCFVRAKKWHHFILFLGRRKCHVGVVVPSVFRDLLRFMYVRKCAAVRVCSNADNRAVEFASRSSVGCVTVCVTR